MPPEFAATLLSANVRRVVLSYFGQVKYFRRDYVSKVRPAVKIYDDGRALMRDGPPSRGRGRR